jgi:hypothetical protein
MGLGRDLSREEAPQRLALLESGAPREAARALPRGPGPPALHLGGDRGVDPGDDPAPLGGGKRVDEGEADEERVVAALRRGRRGEPPGELPPAGGRHPIEESRGSAAGPEGPEKDPAVPPEPGEGRVDLGDAGAPGGAELDLHRPREVVSGARLGVEKTEEDVGEGHARTISI